MEVFFEVRRKKLTLFLDDKANGTVMDIKNQISGIIKRSPDDQRLVHEGKVLNDSDSLNNFCSSGAHNPALLGLMLRDQELGQFEELEIVPYSVPPDFPGIFDKDEK